MFNILYAARINYKYFCVSLCGYLIENVPRINKSNMIIYFFRNHGYYEWNGTTPTEACHPALRACLDWR